MGGRDLIRYIQSIIDLLIQNSDRLAGLQATSIWCLFCLVLIGILTYDKRTAENKDRVWSKIRTDDALNDAKMADALHLLAEDNQRRTETLKELKLIIDERLKRA